MEHGAIAPSSRLPGRPVRLIVESGDPDWFALESTTSAGIDVKFCSGPGSELEVCPLVTEGTCPMGECDVVVSSLDGAWAQPVHNAWLRDGVVVTRAAPDPSSSPSERLDAYVGAALVALYRATYAPGHAPIDEPNP